MELTRAIWLRDVGRTACPAASDDLTFERIE